MLLLTSRKLYERRTDFMERFPILLADVRKTFGSGRFGNPYERRSRPDNHHRGFTELNGHHRTRHQQQRRNRRRLS
jgi:hypothetical protein